MVAGSDAEVTSANRTTLERPTDRELVIARTFNGPSRVVFDAWTKPELLKRWWAPRSLGVSLFSCDADVRVDGAYRYVFGRAADAPMAFSGVYTKVSPPSCLVYTQMFEAAREAGEAIVTATFDEQHGKTHLVLHSLYPTKQALDGALAAGMERGMRETMDQLDKLVGSLR